MATLADWHDYVVAQAGAAAALSDLLFVAFSFSVVDRKGRNALSAP